MNITKCKDTFVSLQNEFVIKLQTFHFGIILEVIYVIPVLTPGIEKDNR